MARAPSVPRFPPAQLRARAGEKVFARGEQIAATRAVALLSADESGVLASVRGTELYRTRLTGGRGKAIGGECSCPAFEDAGFCKHLVAVGLAANAAGDSVPDRGAAIRANLVSLGAARLAEMLMDLAERDAALYRRLDREAGSASRDPAERAAVLADAIAAAFDEVDDEMDADLSDLDDILDAIETLIAAGAAAEAMPLIERLLDDLPPAIETLHEPDDASAALGRAAGLHHAACLALRPDPEALAEQLFERASDDPFGCFDAAEERYAGLLGETGLAVYGALAQRALDRLPPRGRERFDPRDHDRHTLVAILDRLAAREGDLERRIALRRGLLHGEHDYMVFARFLLEHGRDGMAREVAEEGARLFEDARSSDLDLFLAERLRAEGRPEEAMKVLWRAFERAPSGRVFEVLWEAEGSEAADRALAVIRRGRAKPRARTPLIPGWSGVADRDLEIDVLMTAGRLAEAWEAARAGKARDDLVMRLCKASEQAMPAEASRAYRELVENQVARTNGGGYSAACQLIARLRPLEAAGEHAAFLAELRRKHRLKRNFIALLDAQTAPAATGAGG